MKTWLVTGGAGFIGGNFVHHAIAQGHRVVNLDKLTYAGHRETLAAVESSDRHIFVHGDIADRELMKNLLDSHQPDALVHFAAESHVDRSIDGPGEFIQTNIVGTFNLLQCALEYWQSNDKNFRFLHVSTDEVYGSLGETGLFTEETAYQPNSPYSASKAASDHLVRAWHHTYGLPVVTTNCSNNYGPYQFPEKLIPLVIQKAMNYEPIPVYGDGQNVRDWLYVEDHCKGIETALENGRPGETYNIGGHNEMSNLQVVTLICGILDELLPQAGKPKRESLITFVTDRPGHDRRYAIDAGKIGRELGWQPEETFITGINKTVRWYLENEAWCQSVTENQYQGQRLGVSD